MGVSLRWAGRGPSKVEIFALNGEREEKVFPVKSSPAYNAADPVTRLPLIASVTALRIEMRCF